MVRGSRPCSRGVFPQGWPIFPCALNCNDSSSTIFPPRRRRLGDSLRSNGRRLRCAAMGVASLPRLSAFGSASHDDRPRRQATLRLGLPGRQLPLQTNKDLLAALPDGTVPLVSLPLPLVMARLGILSGREIPRTGTISASIAAVHSPARNACQAPDCDYLGGPSRGVYRIIVLNSIVARHRSIGSRQLCPRKSQLKTWSDLVAARIHQSPPEQSVRKAQPRHSQPS
jgi:hypothetical protein